MWTILTKVPGPQIPAFMAREREVKASHLWPREVDELKESIARVGCSSFCLGSRRH